MSFSSSCCPESRREAALLIGQFAASDSDCKVPFHLWFYTPISFILGVILVVLWPSSDHITLQAHIVQRGAVCPLIEMLESPEVKLKEMSAFALGRLAQVINLHICWFSLMS